METPVSAQTQSKDLAPRSCRLFRSAGTEAIWAADDEGLVALVNLLSESSALADMGNRSKRFRGFVSKSYEHRLSIPALASNTNS